MKDFGRERLKGRNVRIAFPMVLRAPAASFNAGHVYVPCGVRMTKIQGIVRRAGIKTPPLRIKRQFGKLFAKTL